MQVREAIHPGTYIGKGKLEELKILVRACDATGIICDDELSSIQLKGWRKHWNARSWTVRF